MQYVLLPAQFIVIILNLAELLLFPHFYFIFKSLLLMVIQHKAIGYRFFDCTEYNKACVLLNITD
jgi:hypothetical protein